MHLAVLMPQSWPTWVGAGFVFVAMVLLTAFLISVAVRKFLHRSPPRPRDDFAAPQPKSENQAAFMAASTQAVIQRLREQEKELERLHRLEKERAQQTERLSEAVTRNMPTGLLLVNANGLIQHANPAAEKVLGSGALSYRRYTDVLGADSPLTRLLTSCLREGNTYQREEVEHRTAAGDVRHLGVTISPSAPADPARPRPTGALCLLSDLTELTALQRQIRMKENMAALGEMSAGIAHEFKNALGIISGYAQMIRSEAAPGEMMESAENILQQTRALTHVVTEFLRFARPLEVGLESVALHPLVEQAAGEIRGALPDVRVQTQGEFRELSGDAGLLRQVLVNLVRNAAEAAQSCGHGQVIIRGAVEEDAGGLVQRIAILDNGPGIPDEELGKIFVPFYTTKSNGTGLGLAVVQKIVLQHGGRVEARNRPEGGAELIVWLPLPAAGSEAVESGPGRI